MTANKFYASNFHELSLEVAQVLSNQGQGIQNLVTALQGLATTSSISGQAADSLKAYVNEVHLSLLAGLGEALQGFQTTIGTYWNAYTAQDGGEDFKFIRGDFDDLQGKLASGKSQLDGYKDQLSNILNSVSDIVSLGSAGTSFLEQISESLSDLRQQTTQTKETWEQFENGDNGFNNVEDLLQRTLDLVNRYANGVNVSRGVNYTAGSFFNSAGDFLTAYQAMNAYMTNSDNQKVANSAWDGLVKDYKTDQKRLQKIAIEEAKKKAAQNFIWDCLQTVAGAVVTVVGLGLTPFTGGASLGLTVLGGMMVVGGLNSAINDGSMAMTGKGLNLVQMASGAVGKWYNSTLGKSLGDKGVGGFVNGFLQGGGEIVSGMAQFNIKSTAEGVYSLATNPQVQSAFMSSASNYMHQLGSGNAVTWGKTGAMVASLFVGGESAEIGKAGETTSLLSRTSEMTTAIAGKASSLLDRTSALSSKLSDLMDKVPSLVVRQVQTTDGRVFSILDKGALSETQLGGRVQQAFSSLSDEASEASGKLSDFASKGSQTVMKQSLPEKLDNELSNFQSKYYDVAGNKVGITKEDMTHILQRHHPDFLDGSTKQAQTYFDKSMTTDDIKDAVGSVIKQNEDTIADKGTNSMYQITGNYKGTDYVLGFKRGHIHQFYPKN